MKKQCFNCGKEFQVREKRRKSTAKFCSIKCYAEARRGIERKPELRRNCIVCGKRFLPIFIQRAKEGWGKYCSMACYTKARASDTKIKCSYCGKEFIRKRYLLNKRKVKNYYCSTDCRNKANRGKNYDPKRIDYRDGQFNKLAKKLRNEATECFDCKKRAEIYRVHHKIPPWLFDNRKEAHERNNLVVLCDKCHKKRHKSTMSYLFRKFREHCKKDKELKDEIIKNWNSLS